MKKRSINDVTLLPTPNGNFTVWAKVQVGSMKPEQVGILTFERMRFGDKIMVYGNYGDPKNEEISEDGKIEIINQLGFYKPLTYEQCLECFNFGKAIDRFEQLFFLTQTTQLS